MADSLKKASLSILLLLIPLSILSSASGSGLHYGQGVFSGFPSPAKKNFLTAFKKEVLDKQKWDGSNAKAKLEMDWTTQTSTRAKNICAKLGVDADFTPFFSAGVNVNVSESSTKNGYSVSFYGLFNSSGYTKGGRALTFEDMEPFAQDLLKNKPGKFLTTYGDKYVVTVDGGVIIESKLTITFDSFSAASSCSAAANAGGSYGPFSADVKAAVSGASSNGNTSGSIHLTITQRGGKPTDLATLPSFIADYYQDSGIPTSKTHNSISIESIDNYSKFQEAFNKGFAMYEKTIPKQMESNNYGVYQVYLQDYPEAPNHESKSLKPIEDKKTALKRLVSVFNTIIDRNRLMYNMLKVSKDSQNRPLMPCSDLVSVALNSKSEYITNTNNIKSTIISFIEDIHSVDASTITQYTNSIADLKNIPKGVEIDSLRPGGKTFNSNDLYDFIKYIHGNCFLRHSSCAGHPQYDMTILVKPTVFYPTRYSYADRKKCKYNRAEIFFASPQDLLNLCKKDLLPEISSQGVYEKALFLHDWQLSMPHKSKNVNEHEVKIDEIPGQGTIYMTMDLLERKSIYLTPYLRILNSDGSLWVDPAKI